MWLKTAEFVFRAMEMKRSILYKKDWALYCNKMPI